MAKGSKTGTRRTFRLNNMVGLMNTEAEENAYSTFDPNAKLGVTVTSIPFEFKNIDNWQPISRGGLSKMSGFDEHFNTSVNSPIRALGRFVKSDGTSLFIYSQGTNVYKLVSGVSTSIGATVADDYHWYETAMDKFIICDGVGVPQVYDGTTVTALATGGDGTAATGFKQVLWYQNQLFGFSATHDTSLLYHSDIGVITTGYSTNFINCDTNDGEKITSIAKFFVPGQFEPIIVVGKERSVGIITGDGTVSNPYAFTKISDKLGIPGFRQIVKYEQDATFLCPRGISSYITASKDINIEQRLLSKNVTNQFTNLSQTYLPDALGWFDWKNRRVSYAIPDANNQYPNVIWHYDIDLGGMYKQTGFYVTSAFVDTDGTLYTADQNGKIYQHSSIVHNYNSTAINATLQTPYLDFFEPDYYKRIVHSKITIRGNGSYNLGIGTSLNYGLKLGSSHTVPVSAGYYLWNGGVWTDDPGVYQWGGSLLQHKKVFPANIFENISFTFSQSGADQPVDLLEMVIEVEYLDLI